MAMREECKPFNAEQAQAGAPYGHCDIDIDVRIDNYFPFYEYVTGRYKYSNEERWQGTSWNYDDGGLVMLPIAHCQSKPVYVGDTLYDENGDKFEVEMVHVGLVPRCSWEAPRKVVRTRMTEDDVVKIFCESDEIFDINKYLDIANAAIARSIEDGDVVPLDTVKQIAEFCQGYGEGGSHPTETMWSHVKKMYLESK